MLNLFFLAIKFWWSLFCGQMAGNSFYSFLFYVTSCPARNQAMGRPRGGGRDLPQGWEQFPVEVACDLSHNQCPPHCGCSGVCSWSRTEFVADAGEGAAVAGATGALGHCRCRPHSFEATFFDVVDKISTIGHYWSHKCKHLYNNSKRQQQHLCYRIMIIIKITEE